MYWLGSIGYESDIRSAATIRSRFVAVTETRGISNSILLVDSYQDCVFGVPERCVPVSLAPKQD